MSTAHERIAALTYGHERNLSDDLATVFDKIAAAWQADIMGRQVATDALKDILKHQQMNGGNLGSVSFICRAALLILKEELP